VPFRLGEVVVALWHECVGWLLLMLNSSLLILMASASLVWRRFIIERSKSTKVSSWAEKFSNSPVKGVALGVDDEESRKREESEIGNNTVHLRYAGVSLVSR